MNVFTKISTAVVLTAASSASFAWGPWNNGNGHNNGYNNGFGDMMGDMMGDADFSMNFSARGNGRGYGNGNGYNGYNGSNGYNNGYAPYGYAPQAAPALTEEQQKEVAAQQAKAAEQYAENQRKAAEFYRQQMQQPAAFVEMQKAAMERHEKFVADMNARREAAKARFDARVESHHKAAISKNGV